MESAEIVHMVNLFLKNTSRKLSGKRVVFSTKRVRTKGYKYGEK